MPRKISVKKSKVSFQKEFYSDIIVEGMLFAKIVRSPVSEGIVKSISHPDLPEGYLLITSRDVPGTNLIDTPSGKIKIFCDGNISYEGQPLALLVGPDEIRVESLLQELVITIDTNTIEDYLPNEYELASTNFDEVQNPDSRTQMIEHTRQIEELIEIKDKFFSDKIAERIVKFGCDDIDEVFGEFPDIVENEWKYALKTPDYTEPNGAFAYWKGDELTIASPTQWLAGLRDTVSEALAIDPNSINIKRTTSTNRGTNSIWFNSIIACQVAIASKKTGAPCKLAYSRYEQDKFLSLMQTISIRHKTAVDKDGFLKAMKVDINFDAGFANPLAQEIIDRLAIASCNVYSCPNVYVKAVATSSLNPSSSVDVQLIDSASFFAVENQMNELCKLTNYTPLEFRLKNFSHPEGKQKNISSPFCLEIEKYSEMLKGLAKMSDFNRKYASYHLDSMDRKFSIIPKNYVSSFSSPLRGIGFACAFEGTGYYGSEIYSPNQSLEVTLENANRLTVHCPPISEQIKESWVKIASDILENPALSINIDSEFEKGEEPALPENIYTNLSIMTNLLKKSCEVLSKQKSAGQYPIKVKKRTIAKKVWNQEEFRGKPFHEISFAAVCLELELNPCTFREEIRSINIVINGGKIAKQETFISTIKLGVQKVLSSLVEDEKVECSNIRIISVQSEKEQAQIGELVYQTIPSAYTQALSQALGCSITSLPLDTESIYEILSRQKEVMETQAEPENQTKEKENENSTNSEQ